MRPLSQIEQARADGRGEAILSICSNGFSVLHWGALLDEQFSTEDKVNRAYGKSGVFAWKMNREAQARCANLPRWWHRRIPGTGEAADVK